MGLGDALGSGIRLQEPEHSADGDVLRQGGELGEDPSQEVMEPIDGLGLLLDLSLQPDGNFAQAEGVCLLR